MNWPAVTAIALALPGAEMATSYGRPAVNVRGKMFVCQGRDDDHFVLRATLDEVEMLKETDPARFYQTPHYEGWPGVLVRYAATDPERGAALIERAWAARASKVQRAKWAGHG